MLSRNVKTLGIVSLLNDISSEIVYPVIPLFLTGVLGAPVLVVGLIEGVADSVSKLLTALSGIASDHRQKRKEFVVWGYSLAAFSQLLMALSNTWPLVLLSRVVNRVGKGVRTSARDALITESTEKVDRGRSFGWHRMMDSLGAVLGPLLSIWILQKLNNNYHQLFLLAFIPALIGTVLVFCFVKEKKKETSKLNIMNFQWNKTSGSFRIFLLISLLFTLGNSSSAFMILRAQDLGLSVTATISTYVLLNLTYALFSMPAGIVADKLGSKKVLFSGFLIFAVVYFSLGLIKSSSWVWVLFLLYGVYMAITDGVSKAYISRLVPHQISASAFGIYDTTMGITTLFASIIAGGLWTIMGSSTPFYFGGVMAMIAAVMFLVLTRRNDLNG